MLTNRGSPAATPGAIRMCIDAKVMSQARMSGIGHTLEGLVRALDADERIDGRFDLRLLTPWDGVSKVRDLGLTRARVVRMPMPIRGWDRWPSLPVLPPLDALVGRGVFLFPHFGNWPLLHSQSLTFIHDIAFLRHPETVGGNLHMLRHNISRWIARSDVIISPSEFSRGEVVQYLGVPRERTAVVPWGVDTEVFRPRGDDEVVAAREKFSLPEHYILYVGNIEPRKNIVRLIRAYRQLPQKTRAQHALVLVGGHGWNHATIDAEIDAAVRDGERVLRPAMYVADDELPAVISGASLLAQPSLYEGFGVAPLQAMACGVPVVAARNSAQPEVVGDAGLFVDALDEHDIARVIHDLLSDEELRDRCTRLGHERARHFSWRQSAGALLDAVAAITPTQ